MDVIFGEWLPRIGGQVGRLGLSPSAIEQRKLGLRFLQLYAQSYGNADQVFTNNNYPQCFTVMTLEHIENEHVVPYLEGAGKWLAFNKFWTQRNTWLQDKSKEDIFKVWIENIKDRFPSHPFVQLGDARTWFTDATARFRSEVKRERTLDPDLSEQRKSEPLYRDLGNDNELRRAKYRAEACIDRKSIHMNLIGSMTSDMNPSQLRECARKLSELNMAEAVDARAGEIMFPRWNEGTWDGYYRTIDMDWSVIKQNERQCMMVFCDLLLYSLCPFFGLGVYFLFGGLRRDGVSDAIRDFIYPYLHNKRRDGVSRRLTETIRDNIGMSDLEELAGKFGWNQTQLEAAKKKRRDRHTSRSFRKGITTELHVHPDLSTKEGMSRSGHTDTNKNHAVYIDSTPAMNAPGGLATAGYSNCHMRPSPYNLECLGDGAAESVQRLLENLFVNDVNELKPGGKLRRVLTTAAAALVASYNDLVVDTNDATKDNMIVHKIREAARLARIDDPEVDTIQNDPRRWLTVLTAWSRRVKSDFQASNPQTPSRDAPVEHQVSSLAETMKEVVTELKEARAELKSVQHQCVLQAQNSHLMVRQMEIQNNRIAAQDRSIEALQADKRKLERMLEAAQRQTPVRGGRM